MREWINNSVWKINMSNAWFRSFIFFFALSLSRCLRVCSCVCYCLLTQSSPCSIFRPKPFMQAHNVTNVLVQCELNTVWVSNCKSDLCVFFARTIHLKCLSFFFISLFVSLKSKWFFEKALLFSQHLDENYNIFFWFNAFCLPLMWEISFELFLSCCLLYIEMQYFFHAVTSNAGFQSHYQFNCSFYSIKWLLFFSISKCIFLCNQAMSHCCTISTMIHTHFCNAKLAIHFEGSLWAKRVCCLLPIQSNK